MRPVIAVLVTLLAAAPACDVLGSCPGAIAQTCGLLENDAPCPTDYACMPVRDATATGICVLEHSVVQVAAGTTHTCAATRDAYVLCWGSNDKGQIGADVGEAAVTAAAVDIERALVSVAAGEGFTCALDGDGAVYCWGDKEAGQTGPRQGLAEPGEPEQIVDIPAVAQLAVGRAHTCTVGVDGNLLCFGENSTGQLGRLTAEPADPMPEAVEGFAGVAVQVASGGFHTCALDENAAVKCWGSNADGQLGRPTEELASSTTPVEVELGLETGPANGGVRVVQVSSGGKFSCALGDNGTVACWGRNDDGQLGGDDPTLTGPDLVQQLNDVAQIACGRVHACARLKDGTVKCWGRGEEGQLGDGAATTNPVPTQVLNIDDAVSVTAGYATHSCALLAQGQVRCWGLNDSNQLGNGTGTNGPAPVVVKNLP